MVIFWVRAVRWQSRKALKRPSHDKLKLANSSWCVWTAQIQSANRLANCWRQIELASILANFFTNFFALVNSYLTCEQLANVCWRLSTSQNTRSVHVICVTLHKMADGLEDERVTFNSSRKFRIVQICGTFRLQGSDFYWYTVSSKAFYYSSAFCFFSGD